MKTIRRKLLIAYAGGLILISLAACARSTPAAEAVETATAVEATRATEVIATGTATSTSEPPTLTPIPTITRTPAPTVEYSTEIVDFTTEDDIHLEGTLFQSEGDIAVVFAHMAGENDQENWVPFANQVARRGFTALTFNFRCYGNSDCGGRGSGSILISMDIGAAIDFLRHQGFERIVCIGASMGGRACVNAAFEHELAGLVNVSGTGSSDAERQDLGDFISPDMPKLFIVSESDPTAGRTAAMTLLHEAAPEPKSFITYPGTAHGTELFDSPHRGAFRQALLDFLAGIR